MCSYVVVVRVCVCVHVFHGAQCFEEILDLDESHALALDALAVLNARLGSELCQERRYDEAIPLLELAVGRNSRDTTLYNLGAALLHEHRPKVRNSMMCVLLLCKVEALSRASVPFYQGNCERMHVYVLLFAPVRDSTPPLRSLHAVCDPPLHHTPHTHHVGRIVRKHTSVFERPFE